MALSRLRKLVQTRLSTSLPLATFMISSLSLVRLVSLGARLLTSVRSQNLFCFSVIKISSSPRDCKQQVSFELLRDKCSSVVESYGFDFSKPAQLYSDASGFGGSCCITQMRLNPLPPEGASNKSLTQLIEVPICQVHPVQSEAVDA